jgi:DNA repair exonuclease SbcCD nuclease subunit
MGINSRAGNILNVLYQIAEIAEKEPLAGVCFCGDFFEAKGTLSVPLIVSAREAIKEIINHCPIIAIKGNHDIAVLEKDAPHSLQTLKQEEFNIIQSAGPATKFYYLSNRMGFILQILGTGSGESLYPLKNKRISPVTERILLLHATFKGTKISPSGYEAEEGVYLQDVEKYMNWYGIKKCFCGDIHLRQQLSEDIWYVGNPIQQEFGEDQEKGILILDTESWDVEFRRLESPQFLRFDYVNKEDPDHGNFRTCLDDYNYFGIQTKSVEDYSEARKLFNTEFNMRILPPPKEFKKSRSEITLDSDDDKILREWMKQDAFAERANEERLFKIGKELLRKGTKQ